MRWQYLTKLFNLNLNKARIKKAPQNTEFEFLANSIPQLVWTFNSKGELTYCNQYWFHYSGKTFSEIRNFEWTNLIYPDDLQIFMNILKKSSHVKSAFKTSVRIKRGIDNSYRRHSLNAVPKLDEIGSIVNWFGFAMDIQDLNDAQERTSDTEKNYALLVEGAKDHGIFLIDVAGNVSTWNYGAERIHGYTSSEIIGKNISCFYTSDAILNNIPSINLRLAKQNGKYEEENWRVKKDGSLFWAKISITALFNSDKTLIGYSKITSDISEKKVFENQLKEQNIELEAFRKLAIDEMQKKTQMLNAILGNMPVGLFRLDNDGVINEEIMPTWVKSSSGEDFLVGKNILDYFPEWKTELPDVIKGNKKVLLTSGKNENKQWYIENFLFPDNVRNEGVIGFALDVTEKIQSEIIIKENEEKFRGLVDSAPDAIVIANEKGEIELVNSQTKNLFGYQTDELIGAKIEILIPDRYANVHSNHRHNFGNSPKTRAMGSNLQLFGKRKDGTEFPVEVS